MNLLNLISKLPLELQIHIYEYNAEHREKMYWVLHDTCNIPYCEVCNKIIMKHIWSARGGDMICCSSKCVDNYFIHY
jgi:hypothetical protein